MRLFLALRVPPDVCGVLEALGLRLRAECPGWRWVRAEGLHITLRFLGEVDPARDRASRDAWVAAAAGVEPFRVALGRVGCVPDARRPRVLWIGVEEAGAAGQLATLAEGVESAARRLGFAPEPKAFRPHLTLARAARGGRAVAPSGGVQDGPAASFEIRALELLSSELRPDGARYTVRASFPFRGCAAGAPERAS